MRALQLWIWRAARSHRVARLCAEHTGASETAQVSSNTCAVLVAVVRDGLVLSADPFNIFVGADVLDTPVAAIERKQGNMAVPVLDNTKAGEIVTRCGGGK